MDWFDFLGRVTPVIASLCAIAGALAGWVASARRSRSRREEDIARKQDAQCLLLKALAKKTLLDAYTHYVVEGECMSTERGSELQDTHDAYRALGGDGFIDRRIWPDLEAVMPTMVDAKTRETSDQPTRAVGGGEDS